VAAFLIFLHPQAFAGFSERDKIFRFFTVFFTTTFLPAFSVFLLWRLKLFVNTVSLRSNRERIIPYVIAMIFYFWVWWVFYNLSDSPPAMVHFTLGAFLAVCSAWMCNIFFKISMHATAVGGMLMFFILLCLNDSYGSGLYLSLALLVTGLVCSSRLLLSDHSPFEIYTGLAVGIASQFVAWQF